MKLDGVWPATVADDRRGPACIGYVFGVVPTTIRRYQPLVVLSILSAEEPDDLYFGALLKGRFTKQNLSLDVSVLDAIYRAYIVLRGHRLRPKKQQLQETQDSKDQEGQRQGQDQDQARPQYNVQHEQEAKEAGGQGQRCTLVSSCAAVCFPVEKRTDAMENLMDVLPSM